MLSGFNKVITGATEMATAIGVEAGVINDGESTYPNPPLKLNTMHYDNWMRFVNAKGIKAFPDNSSIVLIGLSQSGKSAFGNYLLYGGINKNKIFKTGNGIVSETRSCMFPSTTWIRSWSYDDRGDNKNVNLPAIVRIIDTPGLEDSKNMDALNLYNIYKTLERLNKMNIGIGLIAIICKYPTMLASTFFDNLKVYQQIFKEKFDRNVVLVITHIESNPDWLYKQEVSGNDVRFIINKIRDDVSKALNLPHDLTTFVVDSFPVNKLDRKHANSIRNLLIQKAIETEPTFFRLNSFPKPINWLKTDASQIQSIMASRETYQEGFLAHNSELKEITDNILRRQIELEAKVHMSHSYRDKIAELDSMKEVSIHESQYQEGFKFLPWNRAESKFNIQFEYPKSSYKISGCKYTISSDGTHHLSGELKAGVWSSLNGTICAYTLSKNFHYKKINELKMEKITIDSMIDGITTEIRNQQLNQDRIENKINEFQLKIESMSNKINELQDNNISIEEFRSRIIDDGFTKELLILEKNMDEADKISQQIIQCDIIADL